MAIGQGTVNKVILIGRVGQDPELKYTPSGAAVANFSIATNRVWKDSEGTLQKKTDWHRVAMWRKWAEIANTYLKKGSLVYVEGRLETRSWTDQNNVIRYSTEVVGDLLQMIGPKTESAAPPAEAPGPSTEQMPPAEPDITQEIPEDDLPF